MAASTPRGCDAKSPVKVSEFKIRLAGAPKPSAGGTSIGEPMTLNRDQLFTDLDALALAQIEAALRREFGSMMRGHGRATTS